MTFLSTRVSASLCAATVAVSELTCLTSADGKVDCVRIGAASPRAPRKAGDEDQNSDGQFFRSALLRPVVLYPAFQILYLQVAALFGRSGGSRSFALRSVVTRNFVTEFRLRRPPLVFSSQSVTKASVLSARCLLPFCANTRPARLCAISLPPLLAAHRNVRR